MGQPGSLKEQIEKAEIIRADSLKNLEKNPDSYSAKLLLMSIENHLADLHRKIDMEKGLQSKPKG
jgi:hypothetical protein